MIVSKEFLEDPDNQSKLYYQFVRTDSTNKKASILFIHGLAEHSSRYLEIAVKFANKNFNVHLYDQRGSGYSSGERDNATVNM